MCISSIQNPIGTLSSSLCQMLNKEIVGLILVIGLWLLTYYDLFQNPVFELRKQCINQDKTGFLLPLLTTIYTMPGLMPSSLHCVIILCPLYTMCHDLAKWLSHYLYFFSFLFLFFYLRLTTQKGVQESVMSQVSQSHTPGSHSIISHDWSYDRCGKIVHRPCSSCISSIENLMGTLSSSLCQLLNKEQLALFWLGV